MFTQHFANYLLEKGRLSKAHYALVNERHASQRVKLGLIAVAKKMLTKEQTEKLNSMQRQTDRRFGDLAVENGYLSANQVEQLLELQGDSYLQLVQLLTENKVFTLAQIEGYVKEYQLEYGFSNKDIQVLKSGDLDLIIPLFVKIDHVLDVEYMSLAIRNVIRFIHNQPLLGKMKKTRKYSFGNLAFQQVTGDYNLFLGFASQENELLEIAAPFAKEDFTALDEDAFDSICEFINCINGLFATELSYKDIILEMQPPLFAQKQDITSVSDFYVIPITLNGQQTDLIVAIDAQTKIN